MRTEGKFDEEFMNNIGSYRSALNDYAVCFDTTGLDTEIKGAFSDLPLSTLTLVVGACSLPDFTQCMDLDSVINTYLQVIRLEPSLNMADKKNPVKYASNSDFMMSLNPAVNMFIRQNLINQEVIDKAGFLFSDKSVINFTQVSLPFPTSGWRNESHLSCTFNEVLKTVCKPYLTLMMLTSNTKITLSRQYKGLLETLGEIGGLKDLCHLLCFSFYFSYHASATRQVLVRDAFRLKGPTICSSKKSSLKQASAKWKPVGDCLQVSKVAEEKAWQEIESTLDVVRLAREMAVLRFIVESLIDASQREILPTTLIVATIEKIDLRDHYLLEDKSLLEDKGGSKDKVSPTLQKLNDSPPSSLLEPIAHLMKEASPPLLPKFKKKPFRN